MSDEEIRQDIRFHVKRYIDEGIPVLPVNYREKSTRLKKWSDESLVIGIDQFTDKSNVARRLDGIVDIDPDCPEARAICPYLLLKTPRMHGRPSGNNGHGVVTHYFFDAPGLKTEKFCDVDEKQTCLLEIRTGSGHYTLLPPSEILVDEEQPERGYERLCYYEDAGQGMVNPVEHPGPAARVDPPGLRRSAIVAVTATLIARHWPAGNRHNTLLALAGFFRRKGVEQRECVEILEAITRVSERDGPWSECEANVRSTYDKHEDGKTLGAPSLEEFLGKDVVARLMKWWGSTKEKVQGFNAYQVDPKTIDSIWGKVVEVNEPPSLFRRQRRIVMPVAEEIVSNFETLFAHQLKIRLEQECIDLGGAQFVEVEKDLFKEILGRAVSFYKMVGKGDHSSPVPSYPSNDIVVQMLASPIIPLPIARGLIRTPSFDKHGHLISTAGYHRASGLFLAPPPGFRLPEGLPDTETALALWDDLVGEFPFVDDAGRAHALALPLTVLAREMISGPVPMALINKTESGTGGTLLTQAIGWVLLGEALPESSWSSDEEELRKYLTTLLMRGRPIVNLDNITHLHSKDLLQVLSGDVREDRMLGGNELLTIPNRAAFCGSGNNVSFNQEHAGRLYVIRLDAGVENPRLRDKQFKHPALLEWAKEHRPLLVASLLSLIQQWIDAGRPEYKGPRLAGFEAWSQVVGGILQFAGVPGFMENRDKIIETAQRPQDDDLEFFTAWSALPKLGSYRTKELFQLLQQFVPPPSGQENASTRTLGIFLNRHIDKVRTLDDGAIVAIRGTMDGHAKQMKWTLEIRKAAVEPRASRADAEGKKADLPF